MGKMTSEQAKRIGSLVGRVVLNSSSVTFRCGSNSDGKEARDIVQNAFPKAKLTRYNYDLEMFLTVGMSEWKEFRAKFDSSADAKDCFNEVQAAITARQSDPGVTYDPQTGGGGGGNYNYSDPDPTDPDTGTKTNYTTYIIIGAAAIVILLLLFDRKRK